MIAHDQGAIGGKAPAQVVLAGNGNAAAIGLGLRSAPLARELDARFRWLGEGVLLDLPEPAGPARDAAARGQALLVNEDDAGRVLAATLMQWPGALDERYAAAGTATLGAQVGDGRTTFAVWAPTAQRVALCLYPDGAAPASAVAEAYLSETGAAEEKRG